jgi:hypothetical protein
VEPVDSKFNFRFHSLVDMEMGHQNPSMVDMLPMLSNTSEFVSAAELVFRRHSILDTVNNQ